MTPIPRSRRLFRSLAAVTALALIAAACRGDDDDAADDVRSTGRRPPWPRRALPPRRRRRPTSPTLRTTAATRPRQMPLTERPTLQLGRRRPRPVSARRSGTGSSLPPRRRARSRSTRRRVRTSSTCWPSGSTTSTASSWRSTCGTSAVAKPSMSLSGRSAVNQNSGEVARTSVAHLASVSRPSSRRNRRKTRGNRRRAAERAPDRQPAGEAPSMPATRSTAVDAFESAM